MNLSASIMLVDKTVRPVRVEYDPELKYNNSPILKFMTIDPSIKLDDLVIVETHTRHKFTIVKVVEIDFPVDFHDQTPWGWVAQKFDKSAFDKIKATETAIRGRVAKAQEDKARRELADAMGIAGVSFDDLRSQLPAPQPAFVEPAPPAEPPIAPRQRPVTRPPGDDDIF